MKLVDTDETVVLVTGASLTAEERDRPLAYRLKAEIDQRGIGHAYRRAVVVADLWYLQNRIFHLNPTIAIGGPGANAVSHELSEELPTVYSRDERVFVQAEFEGELKRAALWGVDASATSSAVDAFMSEGFLDDLLSRIWRFRTGVFV
ncbi:MAG: hypothetical protein K0S19_124 [Geminicoccaceae bacterium]|jgi:hypothetical protein|nr:hypothetical protein [Geminicoccaceae bacterium]